MSSTDPAPDPDDRPKARPGLRLAGAAPGSAVRGIRARLAPALLPVGLGLALCAWFTAVGLHRLHHGQGNYDLGYFAQAAWLINHGHEPFITARGLHLLGDHSYFVMWPIAWLVRPFPTAEALVVLQAVALASAVWPLHALCRLQSLRPVPTALVLGSFALFPALHNVNAADVHPEALVIPGFLAAVVFAARGRWVLYGLSVGVLLLNREDVPLTVLCLGVLVAVTWHRRAGLLTVAAAAVVLTVVHFWVMPHFTPAGDYTQAYLLPYGNSLTGNLSVALHHPSRVAGDLFSHPNSEYVLFLLGPVALLPLLNARWLLPALPVQILLLLSLRPAAHTINNQYTAQIIPFVCIALVFAVRRLQQLDLPAGGPVLLLGTAGFAGWLSLGLDAPSRSDDIWQPQPPRAAAIRHLSEAVPPSDPVAAGIFAWPYLAERRELFPYPWPAGARPRWVVLEVDDAALVGHPLPSYCRVTAREDVVLLAACS